MPKQNRLTAVELDEISLVDQGAAQGAKVVLMKRAEVCEKREGCAVLKMKDKDMKACAMKADKCPHMEMEEEEEEVEKAPKGIQFSIGFKEGGGSEIQSVVFDSEKWTPEEARQWLKDHDMVSDKLDEKPNTLRFRQKDPEGYARFRMITPGTQVAKALRAKDSWQRVQAAVDLAVRQKYQPETTPGMIAASYLFIRDFFEDSVIVEQDGKTWRVDYEVARDDNGELQVSLGEKMPVEIVYQDVKKADAPPEEPEVPAELLFRLGKVQAQVAEVNRRVDKMNSCHSAADGKFCSGGGGGAAGGFHSNAPGVVAGAAKPLSWPRRPKAGPGQRSGKGQMREGSKVRITGSGLRGEGSRGTVTDVSPSGTYFTVKFSGGHGIFHESDLKHLGHPED